MLDLSVNLVWAEPDRAAPLTRQRGIELTGYLALAFAKHMIDGRSDSSDRVRDLALRRGAFETAREFLGDESRAQLAGAPARLLHDGGEKRDIVPDALDGEGAKRFGLGLDRLEPCCGVSDGLGDHGIVIERNLAALGDAGVVADRDAIPGLLGRRTIA